MVDSTKTAGDAGTLNKTALDALRSANRVEFRHENGMSHILASAETGAPSRDPPAAGEGLRVPCQARIADYEMRGGVRAHPHKTQIDNYTALTGINYTQDEDGLWQTITRLLKVGDDITLLWERGSLTTRTMKAAGFHGDALYLLVKRGNKRFRFLLDTSCGVENEARMVRRVDRSAAANR